MTKITYQFIINLKLKKPGYNLEKKKNVLQM